LEKQNSIKKGDYLLVTPFYLKFISDASVN